MSVFASGSPNVTASSPNESLSAVDQIVVSVGPYMFHTAEDRLTNLLARSRSNRSPPQRIVRLAEPVQPDSIRILHVMGVACMTVGFLRLIMETRTRPILACSSDTRITFPP